MVENNGYAESTGSKWSIACDDAADRASGFNMPGVVIDGHDFFAVHEAAGEAIKRARAGAGPSLLECKLNRYYGHFEGDAQTYRGQDEVKKLRESRDCLAALPRQGDRGRPARCRRPRRDRQARPLAQIEGAVSKAKAAPPPTAADLLTDVYVSY